LHEYVEAMNSYNKAISLDPKNPEVYFDMGNCSRKLKKYKHAIEFYNKALFLKPSHALASSQKKICFLELRNQTKES